MSNENSAVNELKQSTASLFDRAARDYDQQDVRFFSHLGSRLVALADPQPGNEVVDIGCGRGAVLFPAREAVGDSGSVHAIDLAPTMVELCGRDVAAQHWDNVTVVIGDAEQPGLQDSSADLILSGLVLFFLPQPHIAFQNFLAALRPGGKLAFSSFGQEDPRFTPVFLAMIEHMEQPEAAPVNSNVAAPEVTPENIFDDDHQLTELLQHLGYTDVSHIEQRHDFGFESASEWIDWSWTNGGRMMWESIPEDRLDSARVAVERELTAIATERGSVIQQWNVRYTVAHRPLSA